MKHKCLIFFVLVASVLFIDACKTTKNIITSLPCESEAIDDSLYIKELGHGINNNLQFARKWALLDAQAKIITRFCDSIRTFMPLVVYQNDSLSVGFSDTVLFKYSMKQFGGVVIYPKRM